MGYFALLIIFVIALQDTMSNNSGQIAQILSSQINDNGLLLISNAEEWKYYPGDNMEWAQPGYDDSDWYKLSPGGLSISEMPDSLWPGYGWWRLTFKADSLFSQKNWNLYFYGWGASEVYLDGKLAYRYGNFSTDPTNEKSYNPAFNLTNPVSIVEGSVHTLAIRYSFHQAKKIETIFGQRAGNLGFRIGFADNTFNEGRLYLKTLRTFTLGFSGAVLLVLLLIHFALFMKFQRDRSNLFISIYTALALVSCITIFSDVYAELNLLWIRIFYDTWMNTTAIAIILIPYVVASIFGLQKFRKVLYLLIFFPFIAIGHHFELSYVNYLRLLVYLTSIVLTGVCIWNAYLMQKQGVKYVAIGAIGTLIFSVVYILYYSGIIQYEPIFLYSNAIINYTFFPFGLTLYIANRYGYLFGSMEKEVRRRTQELEKAYSDLQNSLEELKATQSQLIQQEKLASLGQLTAGIAHEIKNPLNFVNNFSDLSLELVDEVREEIKDKLTAGSGQLTAILDDIEANLRKIHEHGTRADSIVKSMLQHSRGGSGKMDPTDLNALVKEYVNLSFHGMRASKNSINVDIEMDLDDKVGKVPLIAEDFSRVIVNVCNNGFDAMREKLNGKGKDLTGSQNLSGLDGYQPKLTVRTKKADGSVAIEIEDNGPGIPDEMKDKIMQPFFTTKKGTEGTGLGLSITNDIVKAHRGTIHIESKQDKFTRFRISLTNNG